MLICMSYAALSLWINGHQVAAQSKRLPVLHQREEADLLRAFEPKSFVEMMAASRWAEMSGALIFNVITVATMVDDNVPGNGTCSLREAIQAANANTAVDACQAGALGLDMIVFNVGAGTPTINLTSALPTITEPVTINGNTGGATRVELNGAGAGAGANGLNVTAGGSTLQFLVINRFSGSGIRLQGGSGNTVQNCYIGLDATGANALPNNEGVSIVSSSSNTLTANIISGNTQSGVSISNATATGNQLLSNSIGTDRFAQTAVPNGTNGITITDAPGNFIGIAGSHNVISGNQQNGIAITNASGNQVVGNFIGVDTDGIGPIGNLLSGVLITNSANTIIGGTAVDAGNTISGNGQDGVQITGGASTGNTLQGNFIGVDNTGTAAAPNTQNGVNINGAPNNTVGGTAAGAGNVISGNGVTNVLISGASASGNQMQGNIIGLDATGMLPFSTTDGVAIDSAPGNTIGGTANGASNIISGHTRFGVNIFGAAASGNTVQGNFIGLDLAGTMAVANTSAGVAVSDTTNTTIGGTASGAGNVISGNGTGIDLFSGTGTQIQGNLIGTNPAGTAAIGNNFEGVNIGNSSANTIGGTTVAARNVASGNGQFGINVTSLGTGGNTIQGNFIGTNAAGTAAIANGAGGVALGAANNLLGGLVSGAGNLISGNGDRGVLVGGPAATGNQVQGNFIGVNAAGAATLGNSTNGIEIINALNNTIGGTTAAARNIISGNLSNGVLIESTGLPTTGNLVQGNFIGTDAGGTGDLGNGNNGVLIRSFADVASNNTVGGTASGAGNLISGNGAVGASNSNGVELNGSNATNNFVQGNFIGTNAAGTAALGNSGSGVRIGSASNNTVGGTASGARNIISGNAQHGVAISFSNSNLVAGNFIGTDVNGAADLGNALSGVGVLFGGSNNIIGGTTAAARNIISSNGQHGVLIIGASDGVFTNFVRGNFIGTNAAGTGALANTQDGIRIDESGDNTIGGTAAGAGNVISGNAQNGVVLTNGAPGNQVQGNLIGTNAAGTGALGNAGFGVSGESSNNTVGGTAAGAGNTIAFNNSAGVAVLATVVNFRISNNAIFSNQGLGIDLLPLGVTPNDAGDPDAGANNLQNFPVLTSVGSTGTITGSLDSLPANSAYPVRIEFFANTACDGTNGEGEVFLGSTTIAAPGSFTASVTPVPGKNVITATATDLSGNTSEFSACVLANAAPTITAAAPLTRQQGSPAINSQVATVSDADQAPNTLNVTATPATGTGVTISNILVSNTGQVTADVVASCMATNSTFTLTVTDSAGEMAMATLTVNVTANTQPVLSYATPQSVLVGQPLTVNPATGPSDNGTVTNIVVQNAGTYTGTITVNPTTGVVTLTNAKPVGSHLITIQATDNCGFNTASTFTLNVNCQVITVTPPGVNTGTTGAPFSQTFTQSGGIGATTFSTASTLPNGLTLASSGVLSGTPTQSGTFPINVTATDSNDCMGTASYTLTINCPAITVNPASLPNATTDASYSQTLTASGGTAPYSFAVSSGALPTGLTLAPGGGLSGAPSQSGTFNFTVTATDANGCTGSRAYTLTVACPPFPITINAPSSVSAGQNLSYDVTVGSACPDVPLNTTLTTSTPANTTFQSITAPAGWTCTTPTMGGTGTITCSNSSFAPLTGSPNRPKATATFTIVLRVNPGTPAGTVITNTVNVTGTAPGRPTVTATASSNTTVANGQADVVLTKSGAVTAVSGTTFDYTFNLVNIGPAAADNVTFSDPLPAGTVFVSNTTPSGFTCTTPPSNTNGTVTCTAPSLASGASVSFSITARMNAGVACGTEITNTATANSTTADQNTTNNTSSVITTAQTQSDLAVSVNAPATATPDTSAIYTVTVSNNGPSSGFNTVLNNALPAAFSAEAVSTSTGSCTGVGTNSVNCNLGTLAAGATATVTIQAHVPETCQPTTAVFTATVTSSNCLTDPVAANNSQSKTTTVLLGNVGAGACVPATSAISTDKPGSILFIGLAVSGATAGGSGDSNQNNTRMNLTNVHPTLNVVVHLFFIDGTTCSVADSFLCLTANQTTSFLMSDLDPGTMGYMMMVAVDGPAGFAGGNNTGCPISFNYLIGNANIKFTSSPRREADLSGESVAAQFGSPAPGCNPNSSLAELRFDGSPTGYNQLPRVLALDSIGSRADGNDTILMLGRIDGNWATGLEPIGPVFGLLYSDTEAVASFSFNAGTCLFRQPLSNNFPRTSPRFEQFIPAGRTAWLKLWAGNDVALLGAAFNRNDNSQTSAGAFEGGHNLHVLKLLPSAVITVPVFPPSC
ncbi:MAG: putative Ig domain-containing protein [Acidobacteriota bacterium]